MPKKVALEEPGPLERLFSSSMARLIDFLILYNQWDYSKTDIAENTQVSVRTVIRAIPYLEQHGIIQRTRAVGNAEMYQTNKESPLVQYLIKVAMAIADVDVNQELARQGFNEDKQTKQPTITQENKLTRA